VSESEIFREVDEDLRHEQMVRLWRRFAPYVLGIGLVIVVGTSATVGWRAYTDAQQKYWGELFYEGMLLRTQEEGAEVAIETFANLSEEAGDGYRTLALLDQAALLATNGEPEQALEIYKGLTTDGVNQTMRDLALLYTVFYEIDTGEPGELRERLSSLLPSDNPWHYSASELIGFLALRVGDEGEAKETFNRLAADETAPKAMRDRAKDMVAVLGD